MTLADRDTSADVGARGQQPAVDLKLLLKAEAADVTDPAQLVLKGVDSLQGVSDQALELLKKVRFNGVTSGFGQPEAHLLLVWLI